MKVEYIINVMDDNEKEKALDLLFEWRGNTYTVWARNWLDVNSSNEVGQALVAEIKSTTKIEGIKGVRNILGISLAKAKSFVEVVETYGY